MGAALLHLRFPFVFVLSPIFVWGAHGAPGGWTARTALGFLLVHVALYPGANAFNSAFDRDEGPVGGLARPPALPPHLARWSMVLQAAGAAAAPLLGADFAAAYVALWAIFTAYSHPATRWKASVAGSAAAIVAGQGGLGWYLGWTAAGGGWPPGQTGLLSLAAAAAAVAALYPLTQVYQIAADQARNERSLAAALGVGGTLLWAAGGFALFAAAAWGLGRTGLTLLGLHLALGGAVAAVARPRGWAPTHGAVMAVAYSISGVFLTYMIWTGR